MFSQGGKSEILLDIIGQQMDTSPVPILYLGPTKQFITEQWEPRVEELLEQSVAMQRKAASEKAQTKTRKIIAGVPLRLAHGGSSVALKSDPFGLALTDEVEELLLNVKGAGNPLRLVDERGKTYLDFVHAITSTPGEGIVDVIKDPVSGLEFWAVGDTAEIASMIWRIWQSGTRHQFAIPCPHCDEFFIPRLQLLKWDKPVLEDGREGVATPQLARETAHIDCPWCGAEIQDDGRIEGSFKLRGEMIAPGQWFENGKVCGDPPDAETISYHVSGLCNPFEAWGDMAAKLVDAEASGDPEEIKVVKNGTFGELYAAGGGSVPEWKEVRDLQDEREEGEVPPWATRLVLTADVQKDRILYVIRAWGPRATSALVEAGELHGRTDKPDVWDLLQDVMDDQYGGKKIKLSFIDSGFNPNGKDFLPLNRIYQFCRKNQRNTYPTKGYATMQKPMSKSKPDVNSKAEIVKYGLELIKLNTDHWKRWVHERIRWPVGDPGAWHVHSQVTEAYCRQLVSEARILQPGGRPKWVTRSRENHFFDCEAMQAAASYMLGMHKRKMKSEQEMSENEPGKKVDKGRGDDTPKGLSKPKKKWKILT